MGMMVEVELVEIQLHEQGGPQVVILQEKDAARALSIFVGTFEYIFLEQALREVRHERPMTHDLVMNVMEVFGGKLVGILVDDIRENTFFGKLLVRTGDGETIRIDTRPSDALVLAVKEKVPIYVDENVLRSVAGQTDSEESDGDD
jgi:bifunctional DNase/RNase